MNPEIALEEKVAEMVNNPTNTTTLKPVQSKFEKLNVDHFIFLRSLEFTLNKHHNIHEFINRYWKQAFPEKHFPEGRTLQNLKVAIQYGLVSNAHKEYRIKPTEKFLDSYRRSVDFSDNAEKLTTCLERCEELSELSKIIINPIIFTKGECNMATKKKEKAAVAKVTKEKKPNQSGIIIEMLLARKYTDAEILTEVKKQCPEGGANLSWAQNLRMQINTGKRKGTEIPKTPIVEIGGEKKEPKVKAKAKAKAKEVVAPKAKAKKKSK